MKERLSQLFDKDFFSFSGAFLVLIVASLLVLLIATNFIGDEQAVVETECEGELC